MRVITHKPGETIVQVGSDAVLVDESGAIVVRLLDGIYTPIASAERLYAWLCLEGHAEFQALAMKLRTHVIEQSLNIGIPDGGKPGFFIKTATTMDECITCAMRDARASGALNILGLNATLRDRLGAILAAYIDATRGPGKKTG